MSDRPLRALLVIEDDDFESAGLRVVPISSWQPWDDYSREHTRAVTARTPASRAC